MPRSKREAAIEETTLASISELEGLGISALIMQRKKREALAKQMVGTLYPQILATEIERIDERLEELRHEGIPKDCSRWD